MKLCTILMFSSPYDRFSSYYDTLMKSTDYNYWKNIIHSYCSRYFIFPPERILEIGCGTGNLILPLRRTGFNVTGIDRSKKMLDLARNKLPSDCGLVCCTMENLCFKKNTFRCAVAFFEVLNYLTSIAELELFFNRLKTYMTDDFIFFVDFITEQKILSFFHNGVFKYKLSSDIETEWKCDYDSVNKIAKITTTFKERTKSGEKIYTEEHLKYIFSGPELENMFLKLEFDLCDVLESFTYKCPDKNTERILYVLKGAN